MSDRKKQPRGGDSSSDESDWDADVGDADPAVTQSTADLYTMQQGAGGMMTITPAGKKAAFSDKVPTVVVPIDWRGPYASSVSLWTSYDDFREGQALEPYKDEYDGETYFRGGVSLPPGRYLIRYLVDGDWCIDDNQEVVCSLGNEYNALVVDLENDASDDDSDDSDNSDWGVLEDANLPNLKANMAGILGSLDTSKGMVTITPEMAADAQKLQSELTPEQRGLLTKHAREGSLQWDKHAGKFVIKGAHRVRKPIEEMTPDELRAEKEREKRRKKKKKRKEKRKKAMQENAHAFAAASGGGGGKGGHKVQHPNKRVDQEQFREEMVKREREWREAWILHELKTQEVREKEKNIMREQWKDEREKWIKKIKDYSQEANDLRQELSETKESLEKSLNESSLKESTQKRQEDQFAEERKYLKDELAASKEETVKWQNQFKEMRTEKESIHRALDHSNSAYRADKSALNNELTMMKMDLQKAKNEHEEAVKTVARVEHEKGEMKKETEHVIGEMRKDLALQKQAVNQNAEASKAAVEKALNDRIGDLRQQLKEKNDEMVQLKDRLAAADRDVNEAKRHHAKLDGEIMLLRDQLSSSQRDCASLTEKNATLLERIEKVTTERSSSESTLASKIDAMSASEASMRAQLTEKQAELDATIEALEKARGAVAVSQSTLAREREEFERKSELLTRSRKGLGSQILAIVRYVRSLRDSVTGVKEVALKELAAIKTQHEEVKKIFLQSIQMQASMLEETTRKYKKEMHERRKYFNLVQELRGNIRVFCRFRPYIEDQDNKWKDNRVAVTFKDDHMVTTVSERREADYEFDRIFDFNATQESIFEETKFLVQSCMDGYNVCIFAYGQTGSGKTYTMQGSMEKPGVNMRSLEELFKIRHERSSDYVYKISLNMLEIYNEDIIDLLDKNSRKETKSLAIRKGPNGMYVENLTEWKVDSEADVMRAFETGQKNRSVGVTNMNEHSSRSHMILSVKVIGQNTTAGVTYYGKLHLIDLAGSERLSKSQAEGQRLKETQAINKSLSALGDVIEALQKKQQHIPYRNSKLTHLLSDSLGGHAKTLMFINASPTYSDGEETQCSLNFASRVRNVELGGAVKTVVAPAGEQEAAAKADKQDAAPASESKRVSTKPRVKK